MSQVHEIYFTHKNYTTKTLHFFREIDRIPTRQMDPKKLVSENTLIK